MNRMVRSMLFSLPDVSYKLSPSKVWLYKLVTLELLLLSCFSFVKSFIISILQQYALHGMQCHERCHAVAQQQQSSSLGFIFVHVLSFRSR
jgi:hypothetical protein